MRRKLKKTAKVLLVAGATIGIGALVKAQVTKS